MKYICYACGEKVTPIEIARKIRCPYCGGKVLFKERPETAKKIKSR